MYRLIFYLKKKKRDKEKKLDRSIGRIKKRAVLMTFNFNYNMLCCVFFLFFICYKHRHLAWTILDSSPLSIHAPFILTPSLFLSNLVLSRRQNYKKISNHEQNGDKPPHLLHHFYVCYFCPLVSHQYISRSFLRSFVISLPLFLFTTSLRSIYLTTILLVSSLASQLIIQVTLYHYYRLYNIKALHIYKFFVFTRHYTAIPR